MATFQDVYDAVVAITKRPELVSLTKSAVRMATIRAHDVDFFLRDQALATLPYTINPSNPIVDIANIFGQVTQLNSLKAVLSLDQSSGQPCEKFEWREYTDFWDTDNCLRRSVYTLVGETLKIVPQVQTGLLQVMYCKHPVVTEAAYASWIADDHIDEVAMWAAGILWARTGFLEQAQVAQRDHIGPFKELLVESYLLGEVN